MEADEEEQTGWEATCTQILFGLNAHTSRIDELLERVERQDQAIAALQAERNDAQAEVRVAQAQAQAQVKELAVCESRVHELAAVQQQQQATVEQLQLQLQQHSKDTGESHAEQAAAAARQALHEQLQGIDGRLAALEQLRVSERAGDVERAIDEKARASEALRRGLAELVPTGENVPRKLAEEAASVAHRCDAQLGVLREEAAAWQRRLSQVAALHPSTAAAGAAGAMPPPSPPARAR